MRIVFYNTMSNIFDRNCEHNTCYPKRGTEWDQLAKQYPQHEFILVSKLPGM